MSAHQSTTVHVRAHNFTVDYLPNAGALPTVLRLWLQEYPDDVLRIIDVDTLVLIRMEVQKKDKEREACIAHAVELERLDP